MKKKAWIAGLLLLLLWGSFLGCRQRGAAAPLSTALSLDTRGGESLPSGWEERGYTQYYEASVKEGVLTLSAESNNDVRLLYTLPVEKNSFYLFSGEIATENVENGRGASLSVDNYTIDGACVYSEGITGSSGWQRVSLYFETDQQEQVLLALRLGGYSEDSRGTAFFRNISIEKTDGSEGSYQKLHAWKSSQQDSEKAEWDEHTYKSFFSAFLWLTVLLGVLLIFCMYRNWESLTLKPVTKGLYKPLLIGGVALGLLLRLLLCAWLGGHDTDMSCFIAWGQSIAREGTATFYTAPGHEWYDYPPAYMLFLGGWSTLWNLFGGDAYGVMGKFFYMLPAILSDIGCALLLMDFAKERGLEDKTRLLLGALVFFNPALLYLSGAWGQIDSVLTFLLLLSFLQLYREKRILSGLLFALAVSTKWQALMFGPVYGLFHLISLWKLPGKQRSKKLLETLLAAIGALGVILLLSLPFKGEQGLFWLIQRFLSASSGYDYASVEAYNFMSLIGGNWKAAGQKIGGLISFKSFGTLSIGLSLLLGGYLSYRDSKQKQLQRESFWAQPGSLFLLAALVMALIFTFGHYMHERYVVPVPVLLLFAYVGYKDKRLLLCAILFTLSTFLNELCAMFVVSKAAMDIVRGGAEHNATLYLCSLFEVGSCMYLAKTAWNVISGKKSMPRTAVFEELPRLEEVLSHE